jgi:hypothetical protein
MTPRLNILQEIWNKSQKYIPSEYRALYNPQLSFCIQERDLRGRLLHNGKYDIWDKWKKLIRPLIISSRARKYASAEFTKQKDVEYRRRGQNWHRILEGLILAENFSPRAKLIDVGSHEGEEVSNINFDITCIEPSISVCKKGMSKFPFLNFKVGTADNLPVSDNSYEIYLSLRTWCIAGILADEAMAEARRVLISMGLIIVSFPLRFIGQHSFENAIDDEIKPIAEWTRHILEKNLSYLKVLAAPEDYFMYGRIAPM